MTITARVAAPSPGTWAPTLVTLLVSDTGPGIPPADHERVFERFCRLDEARGRHTGGSGLGLAICRDLMRALGGTIAVESSSSAGTTMAISLAGRTSTDAAAPDDGVEPERDRAMTVLPASESRRRQPRVASSS